MELLARARRGAEFTYAVVALFALTQGPVYRLWSESGEYLTTSPQPSIPHIHFASFVAVQLPAVLLVWRRLSVDVFQRRSIQVLTGLMVWLGLSVLWSTLARQSLPQFVALVLTTIFGMYLATQFSALALWRVIATAMTLGLGFSLLAIWRSWDAATDTEEQYWIGLYYNRNSLAPVAAIGLLASLGVVVTSWRTAKHVWIDRFLAAVLSGVAVLVLWQSASRTSPFALVVALAALLVWLLIRSVFTRFGSVRHYKSFVATITLVVIGLGVFIALRSVDDLNVSGETATFNSRAGLWSQNWSGFLEKPWLGWGWMAARYTVDFYRQGVWWAAFDTEWSHNGYHDLLLGGGVLAGLLFAGVVLVAIRSCDLAQRWEESAPRLLMVCFVLAAATQESFFIGSHFLWALLIASLFAGELRSATSINQQHTSHRTT
jgi:exopolysaccharide production protein ExoQ